MHKNSRIKTIIHHSLFLIRKSEGFTLFELIVAIGIIGILVGGLLILINPVDNIKKAKDTKRKSDLSQIQKVLEQYYQDNGRYPAMVANNDFRIKRLDGTPVDWGTSWQPYMNILPNDTSAPAKNYVYDVDATGQSYWLYANLDRGGSDAQACNGGQACLSLSQRGISSTACGEAQHQICNYGVSSPNVSP